MPEWIVVHSAEEAVDAFDYLGAPVVVKPVSGHHGRDVFVAGTAEEVITALRRGRGRAAGWSWSSHTSPGPTTASWWSGAGSPPPPSCPRPG